MKDYIAAVLLLLPALLKAQTTNYTIKGHMDDLGSSAKLYLSYPTDSGHKNESVLVEKGQFEFKGTCAKPVKASLSIMHPSKPYIPGTGTDQLDIYLESATITINATDSLSKATITGSPLNVDNQELTRLLKPFTDQSKAARAVFFALPKDERTDAAEDELKKKTNAVEASQKHIFVLFIEGHPNSLVSLDALKTFGGYYPEATDVELLYNSLSAAVRNSVDGQHYRKWLDAWKRTAIGSYAPPFTQNDENGKAISLASFKGTYLLVDFWASWCGPCRLENPYVVKAFNKFKNQNFTILSVSLDSKREAWLKAVTADHLDWTQVSDLQYWKNAVAEVYGVRAIPQNFLLDPDGKIIAKNLRGEQLEQKLSTLFPGHAAQTKETNAGGK